MQGLRTTQAVMRTIPLTLDQANALVDSLHRHHKPVLSHRFSIGVQKGGQLVGAAITGRPVARKTPAYSVAEVTRLVTDGTRNACSMLYSASARAAEAMGFDRIQTFILQEELGTSLRASGWYRMTSDGQRCECENGCDKCFSLGGDWNVPSRGGRRTDQPNCGKWRLGKAFPKRESIVELKRETDKEIVPFLFD